MKRLLIVLATILPMSVFGQSFYSTREEPLRGIDTGVEAQEYYPEGTKWTEIRLDTLKYDSWYSKVGDEWVPNFETIEYYVKGVYTSTALGENYQRTYTCAYTNGPEWTDSLTLMINEDVTEYDTYIGVMTPNLVEEFALPGTAYQMEWYIGKVLYYRDITSSNAIGWFNDPQYGIIEEIKEGVFGGKRPLKYVDMNGVRIIHGIGVTEWKDGECLFGQICPYKYSFFNNGKLPEERHYRSMLVHFERGGEVLYDVWPEKGAINEYTDPQTMVIYTYHPNDNSAEVKAGRTYTYGGEEFYVEDVPGSPKAKGEISILDKFMIDGHEYMVSKIGEMAFICIEITKVVIPKTISSIGADAFADCYRLNSVVSYIEDPFDTDAFRYLETSNITLYVPKGCAMKYKAAKGWSNFENIVEMDNTGIDSPTCGLADNSRLFDLQGRQATRTPRKGIYIKNGRKSLYR